MNAESAQHHRPVAARRVSRCAMALALSAACIINPSRAAPPAAAEATSTIAPPAATDPLFKLGPGDAVNVQVLGRPELATTTYVADDDTIPVPLAGKVKVGGLAPDEAARKIAAALREGQYLVDPQVTVFLAQYRSQQASVLGEVRTPARYPIESKTTVFDLLAQAGGITEQGADLVYLLRMDPSGRMQRIPIDLRALTDASRPLSELALRGGDTVFVPRAARFYIYGEVQSPNMYRLEPGMTVLQAISRGGGITPRGSDSRIEIRRHNADGSYLTLNPKLTDPVAADDVIRVKERLF